MALTTSRVFVLIFLQMTFVWNLTFSLSGDDEKNEIRCLKSIKESLEDPHNYITWNFHDQEAADLSRNFAGVECWSGYKLAIREIRLSDLGLKGQFPPGIENCKQLTDLDLSANELSGPIPLELCQKLPYLASLDLSNNSLSGEIPSTMADCLYLNTLKLDHNKLTGRIPWQLGQLQRLRNFSVAHNLLSGEVPDFLGYTPRQDNFANNTGLCGGPLKPCKRPHNLKFDYSFKGGFLVGYVFATASVTTFSICYLCFRYMWKDKK